MCTYTHTHSSNNLIAIHSTYFSKRSLQLDDTVSGCSVVGPWNKPMQHSDDQFAQGVYSLDEESVKKLVT